MKHTPGPWVVLDEKFQSGSPCKTIRRADEKSNYNIAVIGDRMPSAAQWNANARLIAAAPEMLAQLNTVSILLVDLINGDAAGMDVQDVLHHVDSLITRIEGKPAFDKDEDAGCGYDKDDPKHPTYTERMYERADMARKAARENGDE